MYFIYSNHLQERAELVTRLASLSVFDLQRLFCKVFVKVVELRSSAKELERNVDKLEVRDKKNIILWVNYKL